MNKDVTREISTQEIKKDKAFSLRPKKLMDFFGQSHLKSNLHTYIESSEKRKKTLDKIVDAIFQIQGGYALVMMTQNTLIGVRDPYGIRPLVIGKLGKSYVLASETCALDIIGAKFIREVENLSLIHI